MRLCFQMAQEVEQLRQDLKSNLSAANATVAEARKKDQDLEVQKSRLERASATIEALAKEKASCIDQIEVLMLVIIISQNNKISTGTRSRVTGC